MTEPRRPGGRLMTAGYALAGPLLLAYAVTRWASGLAGPRGPGCWWTSGHLCFLGSQLALMVVVVDMARRCAPGKPTVAVRVVEVVALISKADGGLQTLVDLYVGLTAHDRAGMDAHYAAVAATPGLAWIYSPWLFAPFYLALLTLGILLATTERGPRQWLSVLAQVLFVLCGASLDRLPITAVLLTASLALITPRRPAPCRSTDHPLRQP